MAYVGPTTLNLRQELSPKSAVSATVKHGDKLDILFTRRRFLKVRTENDKTGWVDGYQLMTPRQMSDLKQLAEQAKKLPSQGTATVFDILNMHTEPSRQSPAFFQIPEKGIVEVVGHKATPRGSAASTPAVSVSLKEPPRRKKAIAVSGRKVGPPPAAAPPKPPVNWMDMSRDKRIDRLGAPIVSPLPAPAAAKPKPNLFRPRLTEEQKALALEDWSLVRTRDGRVGWVLQRPLVMSIPDEVAQWAQGNRITAYFWLADIKDVEKDQTKQNWLWTTSKRGVNTWEFDTIRVIIYNPRKHRYETAWVDRDLQGYYPVDVTTSGMHSTFSYISQEEDGRYYRKTYNFNGHVAQFASRVACQLPDPNDVKSEPLAVVLAEARTERAWYERAFAPVSKQWKRLFK